MTNKLRESINNQKVVTLSALDFENLIPFFNSYCWAASTLDDMNTGKKKIQFNLDLIESLPCELKKNHRKIFKDSGLIIDGSKSHYTIISTKKGGTILHFINNKLKLKDIGILLKTKKNKFLTNQIWNDKNKLIISNNEIKILSYFSGINKRIPNPYNYRFKIVKYITYEV